MREVVDTIRGEWAAIRGAPRSFAVAVLLVGTAVGGFCYWILKEQIENKQSVIELQAATIDRCENNKGDKTSGTPDNPQNQGQSPPSAQPSVDRHKKIVDAVKPERTSNTQNCASGSACSNNQSGGITAGQVYIGEIRRNLSEHPELKSQILREVPRDKPIQVVAILGDKESIEFANQIHAFFREQDFPLLGSVAQAAYSPELPKGLRLVDLQDHREMVVGTSN